MSGALGALRAAAVEGVGWNPPLALALLAMLTAQGFKFLRALVVRRRADFTRLVGTGGMPSAHAASVTALTTAVGLGAGWDTPLFGATAFFSLVFMYDATGIRRAAGMQARILNRMLEELKDYHTLKPQRLSELLGHTPFEVLVGAVYGALLAWALHP
ncbi:MAG TPA: divergent PAP2 family protein [Longimicrobiaceae bacterium]|nr:divergent PAP2 family protein [Longimicrobiaceae bacterium]